MTDPHQTLFVALRQHRELAEPMPEAGILRPLLVNDLMQYVRGATCAEAAVRARLAVDLSWRRLYQQALQQSNYQLPIAAAADSDDAIVSRVGHGWELKLISAKALPQVYLKLQFDAPWPADGRRFTLHASASAGSAEIEPTHQSIQQPDEQPANVVRLVFPPLLDGQTQLVLANEDPALEVLRTQALYLVADHD